MNCDRLTLEGRYTRLEPLTLDHVPRLAEISKTPEVWKLLSTPLATDEDVLEFVDLALQSQQEGTCVPFATIDKSSGLAIGSTRFANMSPEHGRVEIGWTWIAPQWQRTAVNTEAKYLMLQHAFEIWGCSRVELKINALNDRSRNAILRLGAKQEGILRNHMKNPDGTLRDTVYFSIIDSEWTDVKMSLLKKQNASQDRTG